MEILELPDQPSLWMISLHIFCILVVTRNLIVRSLEFLFLSP